MIPSLLRRAAALAALLPALALAAAGPSPDKHPYDEGADAKAQIRAALAGAREAKKSVLLVFGANWCPDCRLLDQSMKTGATGELVHSHFAVVKVDVGKFDRNLDVAAFYGVPLKKGIPAVALLSPRGKVLESTRAGELADARHMGEAGILAFFEALAARRP